MGPENTLILIDGKPVLSRTSVRMGRGGERDTRGDSNWVPAELIERIEVIRGPAAARYGSGAAGGVVNIITKTPEDDLWQFGVHYNQPESGLEGSTRRANVLWEKRLAQNLSLRLTGNYNESEADDESLNEAVCDDDATTCSYSAPPEGVVNRDGTVRLRWTPTGSDTFDFDIGYSRQGNLFSGDNQLGSINTVAEPGSETNVVRRGTLAVTHSGDYSWGELNSYVQYENTNNKRLTEGAAGGGEGAINSTDDYDRSILDIVSGKSEAIVDSTVLGREAKLTFGAELRYERLDLDGYNSFASTAFDPDADPDPVTTQNNVGFYAEANILWTDRLTLTPSLRMDYVDSFGTNLSGGLNATFRLSEAWTINGGVARAFKSPNLYQLSESYVYTTMGNGCPYPYTGDGPCYVLGNEDLDPETSINTEIGVAYSGLNGINATLTYFHNDYNDKIQSGTDQVGYITYNGTDYRVYQWENIPDSVVEGLEGSFSMPIGETLALTVNATYMIKSEQTLDLPAGTDSSGVSYPAVTVDVPLSLVPEYTINAQIDWQATDRLTITPSLTHYGETEASDYSSTTGYPEDDADLTDRDPYTLVNLAANYEFDNGVRLSGGVTNIFDEQILRSGDGAESYNEPGRAFYLGLNASF